MKDIFIKSRLIAHNETDETAELTKLELGLSNEDEDVWVNLRVSKSSKAGWSADAPAIPITVLESYLVDMKAKGANFIAIEFHCDHGTYLIDGFKYTLADQREEAKRLAKEELARIRGHKKRLESELDRFSHIEAGLLKDL